MIYWFSFVTNIFGQFINQTYHISHGTIIRVTLLFLYGFSGEAIGKLKLIQPFFIFTLKWVYLICRINNLWQIIFGSIPAHEIHSTTLEDAD